jgi:hypothetical protein
MTDHPDFSAQVYQNEYLPDGGQEVDAVVTVTATGAAGLGQPAEAAEVIVIDCSGSMNSPATKISAARQATATAIDTLRDGVSFAVVAGSHVAKMVYPHDARLVPATRQTRSEAKTAVSRLHAEGGTAIGKWLTLANTLLHPHANAIRHAILLTDGRNEHETPEQLQAALAACTGNFTCDCRGVGTDWVVGELREISSALLGTVDIVADPQRLEADFRAMAETAMGKTVADVALRVWTPQAASVRFVKQVMPTVEDLTAKRTTVSPQIGAYPTGAWGDESRDYHICVDVPAAAVGDEMLAARVSVVLPAADGTAQVLAQGLVRAVWTGDTELSTRINPAVAHYTGQAELAQVIQEGLEARKSGDVDTATAKLGRAVALAAQSGNDAVADLLGKVVDVEDPATGTIRLKAKVDDADEMALDTRSTKTVRVGKSGR